MKNFILMLAIASMSCGAASAQLSGTYTIDASQPTGGTNYATFAAAVADLTAFPVGGPVTFLVAPNPVPYAGFTIPGLVVGTSSTNTVTFLGGPGVSMAGAAAGFDLCIYMIRRDLGADVAASVARLAVMPLERAGGHAQFIEHVPPSEGLGAMTPLLTWM